MVGDCNDGRRRGRRRKRSLGLMLLGAESS
jgi:hypothetical protein